MKATPDVGKLEASVKVMEVSPLLTAPFNVLETFEPPSRSKATSM